MKNLNRPYSLKIMADFCSGGLWDMNEGVETTLTAFLPETEEVLKLDDDLNNWCDKYTGGCWHDRPSPEFNWEGFHKEGIDLAKRVKKLMGPNGKVTYFKIIDYPFSQGGWEEIEA